MTVDEFKAHVADLMRAYDFDVQGLQLANGDVILLPREASVVGKVLEVSVKQYLHGRLLSVAGLTILPASGERTYPDLTFDLGTERFACDVKCARRASPTGRAVLSRRDRCSTRR